MTVKQSTTVAAKRAVAMLTLACRLAPCTMNFFTGVNVTLKTIMQQKIPFAEGSTLHLWFECDGQR